MIDRASFDRRLAGEAVRAGVRVVHGRAMAIRVDPDGVTVLWAAHRPSRLPLYVLTTGVIGSLSGDPDVAAAAAVLAELPAQLRHSLASITAPSPDQVTLNLSNGVTVLWGSVSDASAKAKELALLMRTHARYYDVSAPGTVMTN